jgi:hypothetical protein
MKMHYLEKLYTNIVLDSSNNYKSCKQLPTFSEAEKIIKENETELNKLKKFDPGIYWWVDDQRCKQKGELLIFYGSHNSRVEIEKVIRNNDFHGVPASLINV